ncbi:hypothetical protein [Saccharopolyspora sp. ASAGF58]|uniref:hypothetical protein n=1 Tax=Saccharopolyspora sp. ASAGF58 TaxID=2719023 RepID=UPI00143FE66C|nr:hypothetical protein [Saccharopolyspora sp. ASAGF58]QIZ35036.1 hypothetical protein FDZ84_10240 [Saccharopolyspora sp. ASAGF58]
MTARPQLVATGRIRHRPAVLIGVSAVLFAAGCAASATEFEPLRLSKQYFADNNTAAAQGPQAQQKFFRRTQHPDFLDENCELGETTVEIDPAMPTLRPDPEFAPEGIRPRGEIWAIGVEVTTRTAGSVTGHQIGSLHLVLLDGRMHGFAPCPTR